VIAIGRCRRAKNGQNESLVAASVLRAFAIIASRDPEVRRALTRVVNGH
jgi:hypothetical protein